MQNQEYLSPRLVRRDLEDAWRVRCEKARARYQTAKKQYRKLLDQRPEGRVLDHDASLALARHEELEASEEYMRNLRIFCDLTLRGKIPEEHQAETRGGGLSGRRRKSREEADSIRDSIERF